MDGKNINKIYKTVFLMLIILVLSSCVSANSNEKVLRKAFGINHANEAKIIASAINNANLGDIDKIERDKSSDDNRYIIYTEDGNEYILYLSSGYSLQALINNKTKEVIYASTQ